MNVGGAVYDIGVYVVQSAFYTTHSHPLSVKAKAGQKEKIFLKNFQVLGMGDGMAKWEYI